MEIIDSIKSDPRGQGDQGEAAAIIWLLSKDADVYLPFGHSRDIDLITILNGDTLRVQVKTTTQQGKRAMVSRRVHPRRQPELERPREVSRARVL